MSRPLAPILSIALVICTSTHALAAWPPANLKVSPAGVTRSLVTSIPDGSGGVIVAFVETFRGSSDVYAQRVASDGSEPWGPNGIPLCTAAGSQTFPAIVSDGAGGAIVAWEDHRGAGADIYVQRISGGGSVQWAANGVALCTATANQVFPDIASDGSGGAIVCWSDGRNGNFDVFARRINSGGAPQWAADGVALCVSAGSQLNASILAVTSGAIVSWQDARSGGNDIYVQLVSLAGAAQWTANGVALCTAAGEQDVPQVVSDGGNGAIVAWRDMRSGVDQDIYARRVTQTGFPSWTADGVPVCTAAGDQTAPRVVADGSGGAVIAWGDPRTDGGDIYAQRLNSLGSPQWTADGVAVCAATDTQTGPVLAQDGSGGAIIAWSDHRSGGEYDLYAARITGAAALPWAANGVAVCTAPGNPVGPQVVVDGFGGVVAAWGDLRAPTQDVYARRLDSSGIPQWTADGVQLSVRNVDEVKHAMLADGAGGAFIVWEERYLSIDLYAQRVDANGALLWNAAGVAVCTATAEQYSPALCSDGAGGLIAAWYDYRASATTGSDIYVQRFNSAGTAQWTANGVALCTAAGQQSSPAIVSDGASGAVVAWEDYRNGASDIYARRISSAGAPQWAADGLTMCNATGDQTAPVIETDGAGGAIALWVDERSGGKDLYARRVTNAGTLFWTLNGSAVCTASGDQDMQRLVSDGAGGVIAAWRDQRTPPNAAIYAQRLNGSGVIQWALNGAGLCTIAGFHNQPAMVSDAAGGAIVAWSDGRVVSEGGNIYAQRANGAGTPQWATDGVALCTATMAQGAVSLAPDGASGAFAAWEDNRGGVLVGSAVYARRITAAGAPQGPVDGLLVTPAVPYYKAMPLLVTDGAGGAIAAWWDARSSTIYDPDFDIYAQRLTSLGALAVPGPPSPGTRLAVSPNPARAETAIEFSLATPGRVALTLFDAQGRRVRALLDGERPAGVGRVRWDGKDDAGHDTAVGIYLCRLEAPGEVRTTKLVRAR